MVLYELLVGALVFASDELHRQGLDELRRKIREVDPPAPSDRLAALGAAAAAIAANRRTEPAGLARALRGDLDAIVLKKTTKLPSSSPSPPRPSAACRAPSSST